MLGCGNGGQRVELVVGAGQGPVHVSGQLALIQHIEVARFALRREVARVCAKAAHLAPAAHVQHARQAILEAIDNHAAAAMRACAWHRADQVMKLALDGRKIVKNVSVIELQVVQHGGAWPVMHELAALVKKGGVVFIGLDDEGPALAQAGRDTEVEGYTADQKAGFKTCRLQNPTGHGGGGGFSVGAGNGDHMAALQHMLGQPLRSAGVRQACVKDGLHQRKLRRAITELRAADHVAHDKHVRLERHLIGFKTLDQINAQGAQLVTHGRVDAGIATGDFVARFACQCRKAAHEGATDAKNVNVHALILGGMPCRAYSRDFPVASKSGQNASAMSDDLHEIATQAARWVVEDGLEYGAAKRRAARQLGLHGRGALPSNDLVEKAVSDYIAVFCADTQAQELLALRRLALVWMERLDQFRPHLGGAVWHGTATRNADIYLHLFCDDSKSAEMVLIDQQVKYVTRSVTGLTGRSVEALSVHAFCAELNEEIGLHLLIYDFDDVRGALKADAQGRTPRGDAQAVRRLLSQVSA